MNGHVLSRAFGHVRAPACRALLTVGLLSTATAACGDVHFVASPYTPQQIELVYSAQEHLTIVRWRVSATAPVADTRFELLGPDGYEPIDFSRSVYPGGVVACADKRGSCAQYVVRGKYAVAPTARPLRAVNEVYGVFPGGLATPRTIDETLTMKSFFHAGNDVVYVNLTDALKEAGPYYFPRAYERTMWPTTGLCVADTAPEGVSFSPLDATGGFPPDSPLTDAGMYCVATRPVPADGGEAAVVQTRVATVPEVVSRSQVFTPPIERSPIIYQIILDLEIPVADRCAEVVQTIESMIGRYLSATSVPVYKLPTVNLASDGTYPCAQTNGRTVDAAYMAQAAKELVQTLPGVHQQVHLLYFNNLDAPLPTPLVTSFQSLFDALSSSPPGYELGAYSWLFNPGGGAASSLRWWALWIWQTTDMTFELALADYKLRSLPYTTQQHDADEPVPLLSADDAAAHEGHLIKICTASPQVTPVATLPSRHPIFGPTWKITAADPPAYTVSLNNQIVVRAIDFVETNAIVNFQICTRYCDHPYVTSSGSGAASWADSPFCEKQEP